MILPLLLLVALSSGLNGSSVTDAGAQSDPDLVVGGRAVVNEADVNLRDRPDLESEVVSTLAFGDLVSIESISIADSGVGWYEVSTETGVTGFVVGEYLQAAPKLVSGDNVLVNEDAVNVRVLPEPDSESVTSVDSGKRGTVVSGPEFSSDIQWYEVKLDDGSGGWISADLLDLVTKVHRIFEIDSMVYVAAEVSQLHIEPGDNTTVLASIVKGATGLVLTDPEQVDAIDWYHIVFEKNGDTLQGWLAGPTLGGGLTIGGQATISVETLELVSSPSADSSIVATLVAGDVVDIVATPGRVGDVAWFEVALGDVTGFAPGPVLAPIDSDT